MIGRGGGFAGLAQGRQNVLLLQGLAHLHDGEVALLQFQRIQPEAEGEAAAAEKADIAHAGNAAQSVFDHRIHPAGEEGVGIEAAIGAEAQHEQQVIGAAPHLYPQPRHRGRQLAVHHRRFVLGVDLVELRVAAAEAEGDGAAVGGAGGADRVETLEAVELLLQQRGDPLLHHLGAGARVRGAHRDAARRDRRQIFHLQGRQADQAAEQDQQRDHQRQHGPAQEGVGDRSHRDLTPASPPLFLHPHPSRPKLCLIVDSRSRKISLSTSGERILCRFTERPPFPEGALCHGDQTASRRNTTAR